MADNFYLPYLLLLFLVPLLVRWRLGVAACLVATIVELALVVPIFYWMSIYHLFPDPFAGQPTPEHPFAKFRRGQAAGYVQLIIWVAGPVAAALIGGGLALVWSLALAAWRLLAKRTGMAGRYNPPQPGA